jgi:hypothetical protein
MSPRKLALTLAVLISLAAPSLAQAEDVTDTPVVQRDLAIAATYWHRVLPAASHGPVQVVVCPMQTAEGPGGILYPAKDVEAETVAGASLIALSPQTWARMTKPAPYEETIDGRTPRQITVRVMIHEYGHVLGLDDTPEGAGTDAEEVTWAWAGADTPETKPGYGQPSVVRVTAQQRRTGRIV